MTSQPSLLDDRRGAGIVQVLVLVVGLALAGLVAVTALSGQVDARADCAGQEIAALGSGAVRCAGPAGRPAAPGQPTAPPDRRSGAGDGGDPGPRGIQELTSGDPADDEDREPDVGGRPGLAGISLVCSLPFTPDCDGADDFEGVQEAARQVLGLPPEDPGTDTNRDFDAVRDLAAALAPKETNEECDSDDECARGHCHTREDGQQICVDCSAEEIAEFRALIHGPDSFCDSPRGCNRLPLTLPVAEFEARIESGNRCVEARTAERDRCFGGTSTDDGHATAITQALKARDLCECLAEIARLPGLDEAELNRRRGRCRQQVRRQHD